MMSFSDLSPGKWYISVVCICKERLILFPDLTDGKGTLSGRFTVTCSVCEHRGSYVAEHYRHGAGELE